MSMTQSSIVPLRQAPFVTNYFNPIYLFLQQQAGKWFSWKDQMKIAITIASGNSHYYYLLGFSYSIKEQWAKAVTQFRKAIRLDPDNSEYERGLGWAMFNAGNRAEGLSHLYRALELLSSNLHAMTDLATAMLMLGNMERAREYGERTLSFDPSYILAQDFLKTIDRIDGK